MQECCLPREVRLLSCGCLVLRWLSSGSTFAQVPKRLHPYSISSLWPTFGGRKERFQAAHQPPRTVHRVMAGVEALVDEILTLPVTVLPSALWQLKNQPVGHGRQRSV